MINNRLLFAVFLLFSIASSAQTVSLRSGAFQPQPNIGQETVDSFNLSAKRIAGQAFAVIQFEKIPAAAEQKLLLQSGITLLDYLPANSYMVSIRGNLSTSNLKTFGAKSLFQLKPQQKMQDYFANGTIPSWAVKAQGTVDVWISFPKTLDAGEVMIALQQLGITILSEQHKKYGVLALRIATNRIQEIAALPFVEFIQPAPPEDQPLNYNSRAGSRATILNAPTTAGGRGLNGEGVVVGVGDNADIQGHVDFTGRIINRSVYPFNAHGTHVSGTLAGAGIIDERYRGYAPKATIVSQGFSGVLSNAAAYVNDFGMVITNNSYGNIIECEYHGTYDLYSRIMDQQAFDLPHLLHVFSAGNSGGNTCPPFAPSYRTVIGSYQTAKNVVTVGATTDEGNIAGFSSRGPVKDGRLKPEITAQGQGVISTWPTNIYSNNNGTSMSAPGVSGGLTLLYQRYRQLNGGANPKNGLMKALLCNGGMDRGNAGPDFQYGFGWMNLLRSVEALENNRYFIANSTNAITTTHTITVPANTAQLKILLYWNDLPASLVSTKNLVNDLDIEITTPSATVVYPNVLDTASVSAPATTGADHVNNIEQVVINNPAAGTYTFTIKGTTVTNAQQEYFVVYDVMPREVRVTAPGGGEALVPGENTKIAWDGYGLSGAATLEFSPDGGANWSLIDGTADINRLVYTWNVPSVATNNALVRVTKNGTGETAVSSPFTIIGQPTISFSSVQCEGYVGVNWTPVANATDYEVMLLRGDEMKAIATTAATSYNFSGFSKDSVYWVTVRARLNGQAGRRAYAISRQPNTGTCAGAISNNDLKVEAILSPVTGRLFTSTQLGSAQAITIRVKNLDDVAVNSFTVSYSVNGAWVTENVSTPVAASGTYDHTFTTTANLSAPGAYLLAAAVNKPSDIVTANDTLRVTVKQIDNQPIDLTSTFLDNLETAAASTYEKDTLGLTGIERYDFFRTTAFGRARTFVNTGIAYSGNRAITLDANRLHAPGNISYLLGTYNLGTYNTSSNDVRLDFQYLNHGQQPNAANRVWIRGSDISPWIEVYKLDSADQDPGIYLRSGSIEVSNFLAANGQALTPSFGVRWGQWGQFQAADKQMAAGYTFDDIRLYQVFNDVQVLSVDNPAENSCGLTGTTPVQVTVRNASNTTLTNIPVYYRINGGAVITETIPSIGPRTTIQYTFTTPANFSQLGANNLQVYTAYNPDTFKENDTASLVVNNMPIITTFPYLQNFEAGNGYFYTGGRNSSWEYGTPASGKIRSAASGSKAWKTRLSGGYNDNELSYLYTPCFDVTGMAAPTVSFSVAMDIEDCGSTLCDGAWVEYSTDGVNWTKLGTAGAGTNWYNKSGEQLWSVQNYTYWHVATQALPTGISRMRLRFVLATDPGVLREGIAIDDIHVYDNTRGIYDDVTMSAPVTQSVSGNNWIDFISSGKLVASVRPSNATLGSTDVQAYVHTGAVRFTNNQYYHNRNITIKPANNTLADSVLVRFYFLDSETEALLKATGCPTCTKTQSAYELGVSKYTDADKAKENGTIADNNALGWLFITPSNVTKVPFDKGYYAEFKVAGFSEFWLNNGGLNNIAPLPVQLTRFTVVKAGDDVVVGWTVGSESNVLRYEVEVAKGNTALGTNGFVKLVEVASAGNSNVARDYRFTDAERDKTNIRYYRLKIVKADGSFTYSEVRAVSFTDAILLQVYPNPSTGKFNLVYQLAPNENLTAKLYDAKGSLVKEYRSQATGFLQKLSIDLGANNYASGMYLLRVEAGAQQQSFRLVKQ